MTYQTLTKITLILLFVSTISQILTTIMAFVPPIDFIILIYFEILIIFLANISILYWMYFSVQNAHKFSRKEIQYTPGSAVYFWFIPIMNLYKPLAVISETWNASSTNTLSKTRLDNWWSLWIMSALFTVFAVIISRYASLTPLEIMFLRVYIPEFLSIVFFICSYLFVIELSNRQIDKWELS